MSASYWEREKIQNDRSEKNYNYKRKQSQKETVLLDEHSMQRSGKHNKTAEKPDKHFLSPVTKINSNSGRSRWKDVPLMWWDENGALLCLPFPPNYNPSLIMRKTSNKPKLMGIPQSTWPVLLKLSKSSKKKGEGGNYLKSYHSPEKPMETWSLNVMIYPEWYTVREKKTLSKK